MNYLVGYYNTDWVTLAKVINKHLAQLLVDSLDVEYASRGMTIRVEYILNDIDIEE